MSLFEPKPLLATACTALLVLTLLQSLCRVAEAAFATTAHSFGSEDSVIGGFAVEDFEDLTLNNELTVTWRGEFESQVGAPVVGSVSVSGVLPNTFDPTNTSTDCLASGCPFINNVWDGSRALTNGGFSTDLQVTESNRFDYHFAGITEFAFNTGMKAVGVGLSNFQSLNTPRFPRTNHSYFINGQSMGLVESLPGWIPGIDVRNSYLLVTATDGDVINSIVFQNDTMGDGLVFDKLSYLSAVPEPSSFALLLAGGAALAAVRQRRRNKPSAAPDLRRSNWS
jgi:hypothetical protein